MVHRHTIITFIILFLSTTPTLANNESLANRINFAELPKKNYLRSNESCILKSYWLSIEGKHSLSNRMVASCRDCRYSLAINRYYCNLTKANNYFWLNDYKASSRVYYSMINDSIINEALTSSNIESIESMAKNLANTELQIKKQPIYLSLDDKQKFYTVSETSTFIADTGAIFGSIDSRFCNHLIAGKGLSATYTGQVVKSDICQTRLNNNDSLPLLRSNINIVGQAYLNSFNQIFFSNKKANASQMLYKDGGIVFFLADIEFGEKIYNNLKICLDSGALNTSFTPSFYSLIKQRILNLSVKKLTTITPFGRGEGYAKILDKAFLHTKSGYSLNLESVPVFLRGHVFNQCDAVLGSKAISSLIGSIDYKNSKVHLIK